MILINMITSIISFIIINANMIPAYNIDERAVMFQDSTTSYFGYSLLLHSTDNPPRSWMIVGAPMSKLASVEEPGLVYRYDLDSRISKTVRPRELNDETGFIDQVGHNLKISKDHSWFGSAMALQPEDDVLTVCAPRTMITLYSSITRIGSMHGVCYSGNITSDRLELDDKNLDSHDFTSAYWYNPLHGFSVHYPSLSEDKRRIIGSPKQELLGSVRIAGQKNSIYFPKIDDLTMLGYAVSSGHFFDKSQLLYAGGAPGWNLIGRVGIIDPSTDPGTVIAYIDGTTVGEYFGASLGACDLNADGLDDIIVGAPHSGQDHGRVYIYYGNPSRKLKEANIILDGHKGGDLFGYSLTCGDLDGDGVHDLIVGAPWEDNGAIYIFTGPSAHLKFRSLNQRITATSPITTFGFSIAKPVDIDRNGFQDLGVGAYKSNYAIILKSRPTIRTSFQVITIPSALNRNSSEFLVRVCVNHTRKWLPVVESFTLTINIDEALHRVQQSQEVLHHIASWHDEGKPTICLNTTVHLMKVIRNYIDPITIVVNHTFGETRISRKEGVVECSLCPVEYRKIPRTETISLPFDIGCGADEICAASISLSGHFHHTSNWTLLPDGIWIIGSEDIGLEIEIWNQKEPAYLTVLTLNLPKNVFMKSLLSSCTEVEENNISKVICDVANPLFIDSPKTLIFDLDMSNINNGSLDKNNLNFTMSISTRSRQLGESFFAFPLFLKTNASLKLEGQASERTYEVLSNEEATRNVTFKQKYQITKFGQTAISAIRLTVNVPCRIENTDIVTLINEPKIIVSRKVFQCSIHNISILSHQNDNTFNAMDMDDTGMFSLNARSNESRSKRETFSNNSGIFSSLKFSRYNFNCSSSDLQCRQIICDILALKADQDSGQLELQFSMNLSKIISGESKHNDQMTEFVTEAWIDVVQPSVNGTISGSKNVTRVTTSFIVIKPSTRVSVWIIIGSILLGLLALFLIAIGLRMMGFFNRNKRGEMEAMKNEENNDINQFSEIKL